VHRALLLIVIACVVLYGYSHFKSQPPHIRRTLLWKYIVYGLALAAVTLAVFGKLHWIGALIALTFPLVRHVGLIALRRLPVRDWLKNQRFANPTLTTRFLRINVNMASGTMDGEVLDGDFQGRTLDSLSEEELNTLLASYREHDAESGRLLNAYIQYRFSRFSKASGGANQSDSGGGYSASAGNMDRHEALQILGLKGDANKDDIVLAHRKLMQKVHPDRGGSDYLAAKINQAKDFLLKA
jgi:hypothetical protein